MNEAISGLGALGFWLFLGILVAAIVWAIIRKAQIRQEAFIRIVESGQNLDKEIIESVFSPKKEKPWNPERAVAEGMGFVFFLGFGTAFAGFAWEGGINYPIVGLGVFAILWSIYVGFRLEKQDRELEKRKLEGID